MKRRAPGAPNVVSIDRWKERKGAELETARAIFWRGILAVVAPDGRVSAQILRFPDNTPRPYGGDAA